MGLPKLNNIPKYKAKIPSTGEEVSFRPFLVKEEKVMLLALESQDSSQVATAIIDTVIACIDADITSKSLTSYDVEYLFLKIRAKSVGETSKLMLSCTSCKHENEVTVNVEDIKLDVKPTDNIIKITDMISLEMKHPSFEMMAKNEQLSSDSPTSQIFGLIKESILAVVTEEERTLIIDTTNEEFQEFIESMTQDQFANIREYIQSIPKLQHTIKFKCVNCNHDNNITIEGLQSFLS